MKPYQIFKTCQNFPKVLTQPCSSMVKKEKLFKKFQKKFWDSLAAACWKNEKTSENLGKTPKMWESNKLKQ